MFCLFLSKTSISAFLLDVAILHLHYIMYTTVGFWYRFGSSLQSRSLCITLLVFKRDLSEEYILIAYTFCSSVYSACLLCQWTVRLLFCVNDLPHNVQLYGFAPVWTLICRLSRLLSKKDLSHTGSRQLYGFSNVWALICRLRSLSKQKCLLHCWQMNNLVLFKWFVGSLTN
jgi:hypothetical protein